MRILVAEDDPISSRVLVRTLERSGYQVDDAADGLAAIEKLKTTAYDALITDWMMPGADGIEVIRWARQNLSHPPAITMVTALTDSAAREHALASGADAFLTKPVKPALVLSELALVLTRRQVSTPEALAAVSAQPVVAEVQSSARGPFPLVAITASTGGPVAVQQLFAAAPLDADAAYVVVIHGPGWMLESCVAMFARATNLPVSLATQGAPILPGTVVVAPGERHIVIVEGAKVELVDSPPVNLVRPAADPLFFTAADIFGSATTAVVLTGLGRDGAKGAAAISEAGGRVFVEDPESATAPHMPKATLALVRSAQALPLRGLALELKNRLKAQREAAA